MYIHWGITKQLLETLRLIPRCRHEAMPEFCFLKKKTSTVTHFHCCTEECGCIWRENKGENAGYTEEWSHKGKKKDFLNFHFFCPVGYCVF